MIVGALSTDVAREQRLDLPDVVFGGIFQEQDGRRSDWAHNLQAERFFCNSAILLIALLSALQVVVTLTTVYWLVLRVVRVALQVAVAVYADDASTVFCEAQ